MNVPKYMPRSPALTSTPYVLLLVALGVAFLALTQPVEGQRPPSQRTTRFDDVVFAISFSPDGRTLAIARGANEPVRRFGRIELWDTETGKLRHLIRGFDGPIGFISFSPDGQTLISGSTEFHSPKVQQKARSREGVSFGQLKWWDIQTGELKKKLTISGERNDSIWATQSPDGKQLAFGEGFSEFYFDSNPRRFTPLMSRLSFKMKLVDAQTGELRFKLNGDHLGAASFSPDGNLLAVANGPEVKLWNSQTGKEVRKLKDLKGTVTAIAFSPTGLSLAVASTKYKSEYGEHFIKIIANSEIKIFDVSSGEVLLRRRDVGAVNTLAFSPDGTFLLAGGVLPENKGELAGMKLFDFKTGKINDLPTGADYREAVDSLVLSRSGSLLAFRSGPATVKLVDTLKGTVKQTWDADSVGDAAERSTSRFVLSVTRVLAVAFSADGNNVTGESDHGEIKLWDQRTGEVKRQLDDAQDEPSLVAASMDGKSFAEVSHGEVRFWNTDSDAKRTVPPSVQHTISGLAISADGRMLAVGSANEVTLLSPNGEVLKKLSGPEGSLSRLAFSDDGRTLAAADEDGAISLWQVASGRIEKTLTAGIAVTALAFAPNGETLATAGLDNTISLWNLKTGLAQGKLQKHDATINALAFSPNGQLLASGGDDRTIVLWDVAAGKSKRTFKGHDQTVTSLAFSPDGGLLASGSGNASVVLWEVETGKLSRVLR